MDVDWESGCGCLHCELDDFPSQQELPRCIPGQAMRQLSPGTTTRYSWSSKKISWIARGSGE